ncbi:transcriptional regulator GlxA family with amidase domain [Rubricella aquisinus]|uniref:Transcriptional regulator GlxA family with amidase domain n=1 Tax=Rubricella aquisinus TaxID=2028108 RepID=A0A840X144_9RHOB|nr:helix-turn-helix domain-containing protein [Rubricella aquisinus]MBB5515615.1 transcriptional regulator GlxA family with amidase domain [Rubricella aquisinus]
MSDPHHVGLIAFDGSMLAGLLAFADILHAANRLADAPRFRVSLISAHEDNPSLHHPLAAKEGAGDPPYDTLVVPGFWAESLRDISQGIERSHSVLRRFGPISPDQIICGYCAGVCLLAEAGLLAERGATVTWWVQGYMRQKYPNVDWQTDLDFVQDRNIVTASGAMGYVPLSLWLVKRFAGEDVMRDVSRFMVLPRPPVAHDAFRHAALIDQPTALTRRLHTLVRGLPATDLSAAALADAMGMSERTLARRVQQDTGQALGQWARGIKLSQVAQRLAESTQSPGAICAELGFSSEPNLRRMFKATTGMTLSEYRRSFGRFAR